jgi:hypothetical protein
MSCDDKTTGTLDAVYVATNMAHYATWFNLPGLPNGYNWRICFNTGDESTPYLEVPAKFDEPGILIGERSVAIMTASPSET